MIGATNSWLLCFDNLSHIPGWLSDALCRLSTGGGFSTRELYSDAEELILEAQRPVVLTSIEDVATRGDLLERSMVLTLKSIPDSQRKPESTLWSTYEAVRPRILGALLDAVSLAMKNLPNTQLDALPRMADFALWATAAEAGLGLQPGEFMRSYTGNRANANSLALDAEPVAAQLMEFMDTQPNGEWEGTASDLLQRLTAPFGDKKPPAGWPKNARSLGSGLRRLAPSLRRGVGLDLMFDEHKRLEGRSVRIIRIRKDPDLCVNTVNVTSDDTARVDASISGVDAIDDVRLEVASTSGC
jgi:hypothetical protein